MLCRKSEFMGCASTSNNEGFDIEFTIKLENNSTIKLIKNSMIRELQSHLNPDILAIVAVLLHFNHIMI